MNGSKNNIENRGTTETKICEFCKTPIKPLRLVRNGKSRMITACGCAYNMKNGGDIKALLG